MTHGRHGSSAASHQSDVVRVTTELGDVVPHPAESQELVVQPEVTGSLLALQGEEAQGPQPVVDAHQDDLPVQEDLRSIEDRLTGTNNKGSAVEEDDDGEEGSWVSTRVGTVFGVDIEVETILVAEVVKAAVGHT